MTAAGTETPTTGAPTGGSSAPTGASGAGAGTELRRAAASWEHVGDLRRSKPALLFACFGWPLFAVLDVIHVLMGVGAPGDLLPLIVIRMLPVPWFALALVRVQRRPPISEREFRVLVYGAIWGLLLTIALECTITGGLHSLYAEASIAVLGATTMVPRPWREHLPWMAVGGSFYPITMVVGALVFPPMQGQLTDLASLYAFGGHLVILWTTVAVVVIGSHRLWSLRREVFQARSIGRYELRRRIGKGGMGEVWAAWHRGLEREVALKILKLADENDAVAAARFEREVRLSSSLTHPNTVRVFDYGTTEDGLLYYAMELLDGVSLAELVKREGALPPARATHLVLQAARALAEAHARGIVHRDVKPENLFVTSAGGESDFVKVLDFGIARVEEDGANLTRTGAIAGTPATMSPEVIQGDPAVAASDVYGLGAVLYYTLTGRAPFVGEVAASTLIAHLHEAVVPPSARAPGPVPEDLEAVVLRCLQKKPADRYPDGRALADALAATSIAGTWTPAATPVAPRPATLAPPPAAAALATTPETPVPAPTPDEQATAVAVRRRTGSGG